MKITCDHGFYVFEPDKSNELEIFQDRFRLSLVQLERNLFTFSALAALPRYSLNGSAYGETGLTAGVTYSGESAAKIMRENGWVYDVDNEAVVGLTSIVQKVGFRKSNFSYTQRYPTMQAGALFSDGSRLLSFAAVWSEQLDETRIYSFEASA